MNLRSLCSTGISLLASAVVLSGAPSLAHASSLPVGSLPMYPTFVTAELDSSLPPVDATPSVPDEVDAPDNSGEPSGTPGLPDGPTWTVDSTVDDGLEGTATPVPTPSDVAAVQQSTVAGPAPLYGYNYGEMAACHDRLGLAICLQAKAYGDQATSQAQAWYPSSMLYNGAGDAFRHCWWSALMTRNQSVYVAAIVGDLHEHYAVGQPANEKDMDLYNNARGRDVAGMTVNDSHAANYCFNASLNGTLRVLVV